MLGRRPHSICCFQTASVGSVQQLEDEGGGLGVKVAFTEAGSSRQEEVE